MLRCACCQPPCWCLLRPDSPVATPRPTPRRRRHRKSPCAPPSSSRSSTGTPTPAVRSEEHTSELQSLMRISYAVFCLKKKKYHTHTDNNITTFRQNVM